MGHARIRLWERLVGLTFKSVRVYPRLRGGTLITWEMERPVPADVVFRIWYSNTGVDDWAHVVTVVGGGSAVDVERRHYGVSLRQVYRVDAESALEGAASRTHTVGTQHTPHNQLIADAIVRKEYMLMQKRTGTPGLLLKKRHWGALCECVDPDTGESRNSHCLKCYGTGIDKGYFAAVDYIVSFNSPKQRKLQVSDKDVGMADDVQNVQARALICPRLDAGDVWVNCATDERYVVGAVRETRFAGVPLLYEAVELRPAPAADIVYELPLEGAPGGEAGSVRLEDGSFLVYDVVYDGYYPVGIANAALAVFNAPSLAYRLQEGVLLLYDVMDGLYRPVGLNNGVFEAYASTHDVPTITSRVSNGRWLLWDRARSAYYLVGLSAGALTVFEETEV